MFDWSKIFFLYVALSLAVVAIPVVFLVHEIMVSKMLLKKHDEESQRLEDLDSKYLWQRLPQEIPDLSVESETEIPAAEQEQEQEHEQEAIEMSPPEDQ
ncbi:GL12892 [Drosophila persimilis]|uniref:GL12892 n=1 Tax=Drosophila persimilis TaxID=7234 RepID=B4GV75_DROPE|nr:GL12892 [Drosophila persimilis]